MALVSPVIVVPGITGSYLRDEYPIVPEAVWSVAGMVMGNDYRRISLHPDNTRYEAVEPARVQPDRVFEIIYTEIIQELRHNLAEKQDLPVPVYPFAYDWRQPLEVIEESFSLFVQEVIERTKLLKHYYQAGYSDQPLVNLIGHSLGGLIITRYLDHHKTDSHVGKVVTLGTPFRGSFEAILKLAAGTAALGAQDSSSREREAARITPSLYQILPTCPEIEVDPGIPADVFNPAFWQPGILATIEEYVRLNAVQSKAFKTQARKLFNALLTGGRQHQSRVDAFQLADAGLQARDWLCVVGVNTETRVRLKVTNTSGAPSFVLRSSDRLDLWEKESDPQKRRLTGDGTVPFESAIPPFLKPENVVCVSPDDFGYWEVQDRLLAKASSFHGILPNMDMLHRLIVRHLTGATDKHGSTWGRCAPGVTADTWEPPFGLHNLALKTP